MIVVSILFFLQDLLWLILVGMNRETVVETFYIWSVRFFFGAVFAFTVAMALMKLAVIGLYYAYVGEFGKIDFRKRLLMGV